MVRIMSMAAEEFPSGSLAAKYRGMPMSRPRLKQMSCRLVRLKRTLLLTLVRSLGTVT